MRSPGRAPTRIVSLVAVVLLAAACGQATPSAAPPTGPLVTQPPPTTAPSPDPTLAPAQFVLMNFNIEYGGDEVDFAKVIEAIDEANPDVVALEEAEGNTRLVAEALGWPYVSVRHQVVSKLPLIDPPGADGRYLFVEIRPGEVVAISNVHLPSDPYGPYAVVDGATVEEVIQLERETRLPPLQERLDVLPALVSAGIPTFLTGDFNTPSHLDWTAAAVGLRPQILYPIEWPVTLAAEQAGFRDAYRELHPDPVADPGLTWWAGRPLIDGYPDPSEPQDRIDLILSAGATTVTEFRIVGEAGGPQVDIEVSPFGTDHRGVVATFTVTPGVPPAFVAVDERLVTTGHDVTIRFRTGGTLDEQLEVRSADSAGGPAERFAPGTQRDGTWSIGSAGLGVGDHEVRLVSPDGAVIAFAPFSVAEPGAETTLTADAATYASGAPITVSWRDAPGARWDWIGIYPAGGDPIVDDYLFYVYTDQGVTGFVVIDESGEGEWPLAPGEYDAHYLLDDGYVSLAVAPFSVSP